MKNERNPFTQTSLTSPFLPGYAVLEREGEDVAAVESGAAGKFSLNELLYESPYARLNLAADADEQEVFGAAIDTQDWLAEEEDADEVHAGEVHAGHCVCHECELDGETVPTLGFEAPLEAPGLPPDTSLSTEQRAWVLDIGRSGLERLGDATLRERYLEQVNWKEIEFPGNVPAGQKETATIRSHWQLAEELFVAMAGVTPERRVNTGAHKISFRSHRPVAVPGQPGQKLHGEASEAFARMNEAAAREGVALNITSSWRSATRQAALSQSQPNAKAVAKGNSAHMYGLAVDLQMAVRGLGFSAKSYTRSAEKMGLLVRMYRSPVYKWMMLRAKSFGWHPYRREPWHWEYNPPGFKARFEGATPSPSVNAPPVVSSTTAVAAGQPSAEQIRFAQRVLNAAEGERLADDGDPGPNTRAALARFRTKHKLGGGSAFGPATEVALVQRALEDLAQASLFAQIGTRDTTTDQAIAKFRGAHGLGFGSVLDAATRRALTDALAARRASPAQGNVASRVPGEAAAHGGGLVWTLHAQTLSTPVAVFVPPAALRQPQVDLLVYAHGLLGGCPRPKSLPDGFVTDGPFHLGRTVEASQGATVLAVPLLDWNHPGGESAFGASHPRWNALAKPAQLNALIAEVLADVGRAQGVAAPSLRRLVVAGHSRAFDFLEPLAALYDDPQMRQGALSQLAQVWAFDTTYSGQVPRWQRWLAARPGLLAHFFYRPGTKTQAVGDRFFAARGSGLNVWRVNESHCAVPGRRLPALLKALSGGTVHELPEASETLADDGVSDDEIVHGTVTEEFGDEQALNNETHDAWHDETDDLHAEDEFDDESPDDTAAEDEHADVMPELAEAETEVPDLVDEAMAPESWFAADNEAFDGESGLEGDGEDEFEFDEEAAALAEFDGESHDDMQDEWQDELDRELGGKSPLPIPAGQPVPFAQTPPEGSYWPIHTSHKLAHVVSYRVMETGRVEGWAGRMFLAERQGKRNGVLTRRRHVGVDLFANVGDPVVACESGTIVAFDFFYKAKSGQRTYKLLIEHEASGVVANYGEVTPDSLKRNGLAIGSHVAAGQPIGFVSDTAMLHFETYDRGTRTTFRWWRDDKRAPAPLLNPTRYLLFLRERGVKPGPAVLGPPTPHDRPSDPDTGAGSGAGGGAGSGKNTSASVLPTLGVGLTPPTDLGAYRKFRLTTYHVVDQADEPALGVRIPILGSGGKVIAHGSPAFFAQLSLEGTARLSDGRLINVTGKDFPVAHEPYEAVLAYHQKAYARRNAKLKEQGKPPVSTRYSGITVKAGRVVAVMVFHEVSAAKRGVGYGIQRGLAYTPFRTLAADLGLKPNSEPRWKGKGGLVPAHTQVYVKEYDGLSLPDGRGGSFTHDGWFIVNDTGGAIFGAHFDVFTGTDALRKQVKLPSFGQVWFPEIDRRVPADYTRGLEK